MSTLIARMGQRRASVSQWTSANPVLKKGEFALVTYPEAQTGPGGTTWYRLKIGDGTTPWASLPWANLGEGTALDTAMQALINQEVLDRDAAIAAAKVGLWNDRGGYNPSGEQYPSTGGSGTGGALRKGDTWTIEADGTINGLPVDKGDTLRVLVDSPGQDHGKWAISEANVQQATTVQRGSMKLATQATVEDDSTANDTDAVTPRKWWIAWTKGLTLPAWLAAVRGTVLTGFAASTDSVANTDTIEQAVGKLAGGKAGAALAITTQSASYTLAASDAGQDKLLRLALATAGTLTLPPNGSVPIPVGSVINAVQSGAGQVTVTPGSGVTLNSRDAANKTAGQYAPITLVKTDANTWLLTGDITP